MAAAPSSAGARFRQRKISVKQTLQVFKQSELPDLETEDQQRELQQIETGVEKGEEEEHHLQAVINAAQAAIQGAQVEQVFIPTPDASKVWKEYDKYYNGKFIEPATYIKFSATVEDTVGVPYCMDEVDEEYLVKINTESLPKGARNKPCTELEFEIICNRFETVTNEEQPYLVTNPNDVYSYEKIKFYALASDKNSVTDLSRNLETELNVHPFVTLLDQPQEEKPRTLKNLFDLFGELIYDHWKVRRVEKLGKPIFPVLKFEDPTDKDDSNPYVCFRRREIRQARKTRRTDVLGSDRLRKLHSELQHARELVFLVAQREQKRLQSFQAEKEIFRLRCVTKTLKRDLGVKGDEELFVAHRKRKVESKEDKENDIVKDRVKREKIEKAKHSNAKEAAAVLAQQQQILQAKDRKQQQVVSHNTNQAYVKLPASKIPDMDLVTVQAILKEKNEAINRAVLEKLKTRKRDDKGYINLTDNPYNPMFQIANPKSKISESTHIPYSSIATTLYDVETTNYINQKFEDLMRSESAFDNLKTLKGDTGEILKSTSIKHIDSQLHDRNGSTDCSVSEPVARLRKRIGRGGRVMIDRRGLFSRPTVEIDEYLNFDETSIESGNVMDTDKENLVWNEINQLKVRIDEVNRIDDRWRFDRDFSANQVGQISPFSLNPSELNSISNDTQSIRFGSMLLSKSYDHLRDAAHQRQQLLIQQARARALQQQQAKQLAEQQQLQLQQQQQQQQQQQGTLTPQQILQNSNQTFSSLNGNHSNQNGHQSSVNTSSSNSSATPSNSSPIKSSSVPNSTAKIQGPNYHTNQLTQRAKTVSTAGTNGILTSMNSPNISKNNIPKSAGPNSGIDNRMFRNSNTELPNGINGSISKSSNNTNNNNSNSNGSGSTSSIPLINSNLKP